MRIGTRLVLAALPVGAVLLLPTSAEAWPLPTPDQGDPFTMTTDQLACHSGSVRVTLRNQTRQLARFDLRVDSASVATGSIPARKKVIRTVKVNRGSAREIEAYSVSEARPDTLIDSTRVRNDCAWGRGHGRLPYTGPPSDLLGKLATAGGLVVMGGIMWWYGSIWPRSVPDGPL
ncbi:hypothetical protein ACIBIZ_04460 [Nonomuraea spiralis]|uniref:hypothetical protein n=1 Tax=Nonomuraea TaxID=83681 RepID=UPI000F78B452|nr:hypothetical protein [Nonomuraea sp. WAC 01424]RSN14165.1 hypothetical protein DMB42_06340 [Nonomuraea sp. WAC 01424]